jgi:hypothetical protein
MEMHQTHCYATVAITLPNAIWCIDHVTKENLVCRNIYNVKTSQRILYYSYATLKAKAFPRHTDGGRGRGGTAPTHS